MKLKASTIIESITAMVIIGIVFIVGMMVFEQMLRSNPAPLKLRTKLAIDQIVQNTKGDDFFIDEEFEGKGFTIQKKVKVYKDYENLYELDLLAIDQEGKEFLRVKQLIYSAP